MKKGNLLLIYLLITTVLLIDVSIYYSLINHRAKQKQLLSYYITNYKLKEILY